MPRRLPLFSARETADAPAGTATRPRTPGIGIADTMSGDEAVRFALALAVALRGQGARVRLGLLAFASPPQPSGELSEALAHSGAEVSLHAVVPETPQLPFAPDEAALTLLVGLPALAAFDPALAILIGADRALQRWPAGLRAHRERYDLALGVDRPGVAGALAARLGSRDILPHGD